MENNDIITRGVNRCNFGGRRGLIFAICPVRDNDFGDDFFASSNGDFSCLHNSYMLLRFAIRYGRSRIVITCGGLNGAPFRPRLELAPNSNHRLTIHERWVLRYVGVCATGVCVWVAPRNGGGPHLNFRSKHFYCLWYSVATKLDGLVDFYYSFGDYFMVLLVHRSFVLVQVLILDLKALGSYNGCTGVSYGYGSKSGDLYLQVYKNKNGTIRRR